MKSAPLLIAASLSATSLFAHAAQAVTLESKTLEVGIDSGFPRIESYRLKASGAKMAGQPPQTIGINAVQLNGKLESCMVTFARRSDDTGEYRMSFSQAGIDVTLTVSVDDDGVLMKFGSVKETGSTRLESLVFPGTAQLAVSSDQQAAQLAALSAQGYAISKETLAPLSSLPAMDAPESGNYLFVANGGIAAGIAGNHLHDVQRVAWRISDQSGVKTCHAWQPLWQFRGTDGEMLDPPWTRVFVTGDRNGDGTADWQDAALVYRSSMPHPFGADLVKSSVADQIAMDFASLAQQPFLRILDGIKKANLATDGIGQVVTVKGYTAEGHDSANTDYGGHYNERAGGLKDLTVLLNNAGKYNARVGVHINATEVYPEARRYKRGILDLDGDGKPKGGWAWLDHSHLIDKNKDVLTGDLGGSLEEMRRELPGLGFIYLDVYGESGWAGWKTASKINSLGLPLHTEYSTALDPWTTWSHLRKINGRIARFLWNADRDIHESDPLLRGADHVGFLGWQGERDLHSFVSVTFSRNLPTKFLQHFELQRWRPGKEAVFSDGVKVARTGEQVTCTRDGRVLMTWTGGGADNRLFVPWNPKTAEKVYVWDDVGGPLERDLPAAWGACSEVFLYELTTRGRIDETRVPVSGGRVTLNVKKSTPFVIYPKPAPPPKPMDWGEGGLVADPGFDGGALGAWKAEPATAADTLKVGELPTGDGILAIAGPATVPTGVSQVLSGLEAGMTYTASTWVRIKGGRMAVISITPEGGQPFHNRVSRTNVRNRNDSDAKLGTFFQRLKVTFTLPPGCTRANLQLLAAPDSAGAKVEFDDVRVVKSGISPEASKHGYFEDFENVDQGWGPFVYATAGQTQTHLSETNEGITRDTVRGRFSFKTRDEPAGMVVRSLPSHLRFKPATRYRIALETMADSAVYRIMVRSRAGSAGNVRFEQAIAEGLSKVGGEFITSRSEETFLSLEKSEKGGGMCVLDDIAIDELGPAPADSVPEDAGDDSLSGMRLLIDEAFQNPLDGWWSPVVSRHQGTVATVEDGCLAIKAAANVTALVERNVPAGTAAVETTLSLSGAGGETWGPGLCLVWPDGRMLRVNLRGPEKRFGIDATGSPQQITGSFDPETAVFLRIRASGEQMLVESRAEDEEEDWQVLARFPRQQFAGDPVRVRLGKSHGVEGTDDNGTPGAEGISRFVRLRVFGR